MAYWEDDLKAIFDVNTPGAYTSTYTPNGGSPKTIVVLRDDSEVEPDEFGDISVLTISTNIQVRTSDIAGLAFGDSFLIASENFTVREFYNGGTGITFIKLELN